MARLPARPSDCCRNSSAFRFAKLSTELVARLSKDWAGDVKAFDAVYDHILHMADALSDGIIKQFPEKFGGGVTSPTGR